ncbi:protein NCBP2AS2 homolog [Ruditapes philippinarum]|uniref:protein NCBP2AS2 homolog n=1 Tax=Ruditapes philippinarum TaxID=129788 RepID=UPI00295B0C8B|nr:protein NCBP2AS2 homolog [Ruditapes philippinarum]XP_060563921.1 protein NCBP2AS2 homolog [Ruditapes philippinarum]
MPWRYLIRFFTHNEQLIQKLSETGPIRYAARMTVYWFLRAKETGIEKLKRDPNSIEDTSRGKRFSDRFKEELEKGMKELEDKKDKDRN